MSTRTPARALFQALVDDAAVFPPGNAPVAVAWAGHLRLRRGRYADLLGPLLVGTTHVRELMRVAAVPGDRGAPVDVTVVARPGTPVDDLVAAVTLLRDAQPVRVVGLETAWDGEGRWRRALGLQLPVAVEVDDPATLPRALDGLLAATDDGARTLAKLRTQTTTERPVPPPAELAAFLSAAHARDLPVKLTGGLHHAVAGTAPDGSTLERHGVLNVLAALVRLDEGTGTDVPSLADALADDDVERLRATLARVDDALAARLRHRFRSFGCCGVTDPLDELVELGLLDP